ncbi:16S rRNA (uracil(1498)-N(3))-methyltransferase [Mycetocola sp.]|jgi:16S rRNA (uracil1498-N3)-methyltransferase|uniref:16S rRNA (uracil(1498)-N(3))-methyltransferase n=1 Tax=Mycetocola sp. TaxID=1871042 RepID=UPI00262C54E8|nr:16S rRNA (uracil(1498)-N(3))-methyltransferase [Mycetocola sp.]MCU1560970.1 Ribosomal small subunit methyltransferase [Mycetocola sp.]
MSSLYLREDLGTAENGAMVELAGAEAKHAVTVNRSRIGDEIRIGNGRGLIVRGVIETLELGTVGVRAIEVTVEQEPSPRLVLVQALAKGDRDEMAIQAATELGVSAIIPWAASRSVSRWEGMKKEKGRIRWETIVREASKQSIRSFVPPVFPIASTADLQKLAGTSRVVLLDPTASERLSQLDVAGDGRDILLVVGPEGGISDAELESVSAAGAIRTRLGDTVLRTSSAGPAALAVLNVALGRW